MIILFEEGYQSQDTEKAEICQIKKTNYLIK